MSRLHSILLAITLTAPLAGTVVADPAGGTPIAKSGAIRRPIEGTKDEYAEDVMKIHGVTTFGVEARGKRKVLLITVQDIDAKLHVQSLVREQIQGYPVVVEVGGIAKPLDKAAPAK
jgi:hypothetical protein